MFIYMMAIYGAIVLAMGVVGNEAELVVFGLVMLFLGNLHRLGKVLLRAQKHFKANPSSSR
ncbi:conserved hypothetical protein [Pyrobaculum islandicum DSM 4184]|uniref:Uncharacterized protein n=2 Tax=Pyrobaculum islandicum TaxID=2277 RepID=A1RTE9_PYRIL|nr:conserved hypothetical protein [Pyrobaculum islandicum DSM 4184]